MSFNELKAKSPNSEKEIKFNIKESFEIQENYELIIAYNEQLIYFQINEKNNIIKEDYSLYLSLEELFKMNNFFKMFETLKDVFDSLKNLITKKFLSIIKEEKKMKIKIINPAINREFYITIPLKEFQNELNSIIPYINNLNDKIKNLENEVNTIKNKFNDIHDIYIYRNDIIQFIKEKKEKEKRTKELYESYDINKSNIINKDEIDLIIRWIDYKNPSKIKLLLDSKIDGDVIETFLSKCEGKYPTIVLIKTTKGKRFGGYSSIPWRVTNGSYDTDVNSFIFSLDKKKKYKILKPEKAIITNTHYFTFADGEGFRINQNCTSQNKNYSEDNNKVYSTNKYELNGERNFTVSSYEVYQIEY